jgi:large subunit ribosomal protein L28
MAKRCDLLGTRAQNGHNVSHSNRKTKRRFRPNVQQVSLISDALGHSVSLRITTRTLRSVQKVGGLDAFLLGTADLRLSEEAQHLKRRVRRALAG